MFVRTWGGWSVSFFSKAKLNDFGDSLGYFELGNGYISVKPKLMEEKRIDESELDGWHYRAIHGKR
jgi:hypothetical protein